MKTIIVFGKHKSGKTTVVETIVKGLSQKGFSVATIKNIHSSDFNPDLQNTDTYKHATAGSILTAGIGLQKTAIFISKRIDLQSLLDYINSFKPDYLIIEGDLPVEGIKIFCAHQPEELQITDSSIIAISGIVSNIISNFNHLPVLHPIKQGSELVSLVLEGKKL